jgi:hypothetical protein
VERSGEEGRTAGQRGDERIVVYGVRVWSRGAIERAVGEDDAVRGRRPWEG